MRLYSFVNANYLKHVQHGLQTAHAIAELYEKYGFYDSLVQSKTLRTWAKNHRTIIILDGGDCEDLSDIHHFFDSHVQDLKLPFAYFHENRRSLNNALTAVAVVVPENIYAVRKKEVLREDGSVIMNNYSLMKDEIECHHHWPNTATEEFYNLLKSKPLAR